MGRYQRRPTNAGLYSAAGAAARGAWNLYKGYKSATSRATRLPMSRTRIQNRRSTRTRSGAGTSYQHDSKVVYRRKPGSKRAKRASNRFARRVNSVIDRSAATCQLVLSNGFSVTSVDDGQNIFSVLLGGVAGTTANWNGDLVRIMNMRAEATDTLPNSNRRVHMKTMILDCTFKNDFVEPGVIQGDSPEFRDPIELDIYEFYVKKDAPFATAQVLMDGEQVLDVSTHQSYGALTPTQVRRLHSIFGMLDRMLRSRRKRSILLLPATALPTRFERVGTGGFRTTKSMICLSLLSA